MNRIQKKIDVNYEGRRFIVTHSYQNGPTTTVVTDSEGVEYPRRAKALLREKAKELSLSEDGYLYKGSKELDTHSYFRDLYKLINGKGTLS